MAYEFDLASAMKKNLNKFAEDQKKDIEGLYEVDADPSTDKLLDEGHEGKTTLVDSYTTEGGMIEDLTEQQDKDEEILDHTPNGQTHKNAIKEFVNQIALIAEEMDLRGEEALAKFADELLGKLVKEADLNKTALAPLVIPAAYWVGAGLVTLVGSGVAAWYNLSYSNEKDVKNIGVENAINQLDTAINTFLKFMHENTTGEEQSTTPNKFVELHNLIGNLRKTRLAYMTALKNLSLKQIDPSQQIGAENIKQIANDPNAKAFVDKINKYSKIYAGYIEGKIIPELNEYVSYAKHYFNLIKNVDPKDQSSWQSMKRWLGIGTNKDMADDVLKSLDNTINSLAADVKLRQLEQNDAIQSIQKKIQTDLSAEFDESKKENSTDISGQFT